MKAYRHRPRAILAHHCATKGVHEIADLGTVETLRDDVYIVWEAGAPPIECSGEAFRAKYEEVVEPGVEPVGPAGPTVWEHLNED